MLNEHPMTAMSELMTNGGFDDHWNDVAESLSRPRYGICAIDNYVYAQLPSRNHNVIVQGTTGRCYGYVDVTHIDTFYDLDYMITLYRNILGQRIIFVTKTPIGSAILNRIAPSEWLVSFGDYTWGMYEQSVLPRTLSTIRRNRATSINEHASPMPYASDEHIVNRLEGHPLRVLQLTSAFLKTGNSPQFLHETITNNITAAESYRQANTELERTARLTGITYETLADIMESIRNSYEPEFNVSITNNTTEPIESIIIDNSNNTTNITYEPESNHLSFEQIDSRPFSLEETCAIFGLLPDHVFPDSMYTTPLPSMSTFDALTADSARVDASNEEAQAEIDAWDQIIKKAGDNADRNRR